MLAKEFKLSEMKLEHWLHMLSELYAGVCVRETAGQLEDQAYRFMFATLRITQSMNPAS